MSKESTFGTSTFSNTGNTDMNIAIGDGAIGQQTNTVVQTISGNSNIASASGSINVSSSKGHNVSIVNGVVSVNGKEVDPEDCAAMGITINRSNPKMSKDTGHISKVLQAENDLLNLFKYKYGTSSPLVRAVLDLRKYPDSAGRQAVVDEEVIKAGANKDPDCVAAAQKITDALNDDIKDGKNELLQIIADLRKELPALPLSDKVMAKVLNKLEAIELESEEDNPDKDLIALTLVDITNIIAADIT